jgi:hypothetical protein
VTSGKVGGDFMVDCLKAIDIDFVASCPGSTFRGLQESIINYGMNSKPEFITCLHEEASAPCAMAMPRSQASRWRRWFTAWLARSMRRWRSTMRIATRLRSLCIAGNVGVGTARRPGVEWAHSAHDQATIVRDYVKWDDQANNLQDFRRRSGARL